MPDRYRRKDAGFVALEQTTAAPVEAKTLKEENFALVRFLHALFPPVRRPLPSFARDLGLFIAAP